MSSPMSVLVVDDEPLARRRLQLGLAQVPFVRFVGAAGDGRDALDQIQAKSPDLVLLDIRMPGLDGFDIVRLAAQHQAMPDFIFVTAFDEFAVRAFQAHAVDYLLKPVEFDRLCAALDRARIHRAARLAQHRVAELSEVVATLRSDHRPAETRYEREFWIKDRGQWVRVPVEAIDWIEAERDYMRLHCSARSFLLRATMAALVSALDPQDWIRIHRSTLVRRSRMDVVRRNATGGLVVRLTNGQETPVGRAYAAAVAREIVNDVHHGARLHRTDD